MHASFHSIVASEGAKLAKSGAMPTIVRNLADNSIIHQNDYVTDDFKSEQLIEKKGRVELPYATAEMHSWCFDGIRMGYSNWQYTDYITSHWKGDLDIVHMHFNLRGKMTMQMPDVAPFVLNSYQHNMFYANGFESVMRNEELHSETFMIQFTRDTFSRLTQEAGGLLQRFNEKVAEGKPVALAENNLYVDVLLHAAIKDILNCPYEGGLRKMYLYSKCMEILVMQADAYTRALDSTNKYCKTEYDKERILFARDYLVQHTDLPPSLSELARRSGINEYKLKKGFKEVFGNTVFGYLADYRLQEAKTALAEGKKSATEIAFDLGYSSLQHFSNAFKKKFGVSPKGR